MNLNAFMTILIFTIVYCVYPNETKEVLDMCREWIMANLPSLNSDGVSN